MAGKVGGFYRKALAAVDQLELDAAADLQDLAEEIAVTRMKISDALEAEDDAAYFKAMRMLRELVATQHRIAGTAGKNLGENIAGLLEDLGVLLDPAP